MLKPYQFMVALLLASCNLNAQTVDVRNAWVAATVEGENNTQAFMSLTSKEGTKLVGISSPVADFVELHETKFEKHVSKMHVLPWLDLPAGVAVRLKPGGYHMMLMDIKQPLTNNSTVPMTLHFQNINGVESRAEVIAYARTIDLSYVAKNTAEDGTHKHWKRKDGVICQSNAAYILSIFCESCCFTQY